MINYSSVAPQMIKNLMEDVQLFETWEHKFTIQVHGIPRPVAKWLANMISNLILPI